MNLQTIKNTYKSASKVFFHKIKTIFVTRYSYAAKRKPVAY